MSQDKSQIISKKQIFLFGNHDFKALLLDRLSMIWLFDVKPTQFSNVQSSRPWPPVMQSCQTVLKLSVCLDPTLTPLAVEMFPWLMETKNKQVIISSLNTEAVVALIHVSCFWIFIFTLITVKVGINLSKTNFYIVLLSKCSSLYINISTVLIGSLKTSILFSIDHWFLLTKK